MKAPVSSASRCRSAEHLQAPFEASHLDVVPPTGQPGRPVEPEVDHRPRVGLVEAARCVPLFEYPKAREVPSDAGLSSNARLYASMAPRPSKARCKMAARISFPNPCPWCLLPSHEPVSTVRTSPNRLAMRSCTPIGRPSRNTAPVKVQSSSFQLARLRHHHCKESPWRTGAGASVQGLRKGIVAGS